MKALHKFMMMVTGIAISDGVRYLLFAGFAWLAAYVLFRNRWLKRKVNQSFPTSADIRREIALSLLTVVIYGIVGGVTILAWKRGWTQMYKDLHAYGMTWFWVSVGLTIFLHDTYFYWTHRMMHHPRLFRWFHRAHHLSTNPSPWASYAFDPLEAFVQAGIFPLTIFLFPIHPLAFLLFMVWQITFNVLGHTGYEIHPRWLMDSWLGRFINTPTNHVMHHESFRGNYGLYFNLWDRLMGTNHARYEERFREVTSRAA